MRPLHPLPIARTAAVRVFRSTSTPAAMPLIATHICDRGWRGQGVRVYVWSCGTIAVVTACSGADDALLKQCPDRLLATYARHGLHDPGPMYLDVLRQLREAMAA